MLPSDSEDAQLTETDVSDEETPSAAPSRTTASESNFDDQDEDEYTDDDEDEEEDEWQPPSAKMSKGKRPPSPSVSPSPSKARQPVVSKVSSKKSRVSKLAQDMDDLDIKSHPAGEFYFNFLQ